MNNLLHQCLAPPTPINHCQHEAEGIIIGSRPSTQKEKRRPAKNLKFEKPICLVVFWGISLFFIGAVQAQGSQELTPIRLSVEVDKKDLTPGQSSLLYQSIMFQLAKNDLELIDRSGTKDLKSAIMAIDELMESQKEQETNNKHIETTKEEPNSFDDSDLKLLVEATKENDPDRPKTGFFRIELTAIERNTGYKAATVNIHSQEFLVGLPSIENKAWDETIQKAISNLIPAIKDYQQFVTREGLPVQIIVHAPYPGLYNPLKSQLDTLCTRTKPDQESQDKLVFSLRCKESSSDLRGKILAFIEENPSGKDYECVHLSSMGMVFMPVRKP
jgi:hypothetical protein